MDESHIIALKDVDSTYRTKSQDQLYLQSINLVIQVGDILGIVGRSGSGKSALLRCIGLLERPLTGKVSIDNKNLTFMASKDLVAERRMVGLITAKPILLNSKNVFQNVALPLQIQNYNKDLMQKSVDNALNKVGLEFKGHLYPSSLSPMQKIQLDIARNLVNNPKILLCDDIFNGLDPKATETITNLLRNLQQELNLTLIITSNDADVIKNLCKNVIVMHAGKIVEHCSVLDLFTKPTSDVAKDFLRYTAKQELPTSLRRKIVTQETADHIALVRISFTNCLAPEEILSNTIDAYELKMNIIQAYQEKIHDAFINVMLIEIHGANNTIGEAVKFLNNNSLQSEIIGYVPNLT